MWNWIQAESPLLATPARSGAPRARVETAEWGRALSPVSANLSEANECPELDNGAYHSCTTLFWWIARGRALYATFLGEAGGTGSAAASVDAEGERGAAKAGSGTTAGGGIISKAAP